MYKEVLRSIEGIGLYPIISLVVFFLFFTTVFLWVARMRREEAEKLGSMPLDDEETTEPETGDTSHGQV